MAKLPETSVRDPVRKENDPGPFWNGHSAVIASHLVLPTENDYAGSDMTLSDELQANPMWESWFSTRLFSSESELAGDLLRNQRFFSRRMYGLGSYHKQTDKAFSDGGAEKDIQKPD